MNIASSAVLLLAAFLAGLLAQRADPSPRWQVQLAALLYALCAAILLMPANSASDAVAPFAIAAVPTLLSLALYARLVREAKTTTTTVTLGVSAAAALAALALVQPVLLFLSLLANVIALTALGVAHWRTDRNASTLVLAVAISQTAGASAYLHGGFQMLAPFAAAGLMGTTLLVAAPSGVRVEQKRRWRSRPLAVRRKR